MAFDDQAADIVFASIMPVSVLLGYMIPRLIDEYAQGDARAAGVAYALNVMGCVAGPLLAGYLLLPWLGVKWSLIVLALSYAVFFARGARDLRLRDGDDVSLARLR